jgi:hypothetical protein
MSDTVSSLLEQNIRDVFGERDDAARLAAIRRILADDIVFSDAEGVARGHDEVNAKARSILEGAPGFAFTPVGPPRVAQDLGVQAWAFGPAGEDPVVSGLDVITVVDGRIATLHTLLA